jgi:hypothetical protein
MTFNIIVSPGPELNFNPVGLVFGPKLINRYRIDIVIDGMMDDSLLCFSIA